MKGTSHPKAIVSVAQFDFHRRPTLYN